MAANIGVVSLRGIYHEDSAYSFLLASGIVQADIGKAVTLDSSAANTVKLAGDADPILGRLESVEARTAEGVTVGTVVLNGAFDFPVNPDATASSPDETPAVGDFITGGTATDTTKGYVQKSLNNAATRWQVVELLTSPTRVVAISL
jgi:hypothetical protein